MFLRDKTGFNRDVSISTSLQKNFSMSTLLNYTFVTFYTLINNKHLSITQEAMFHCLVRHKFFAQFNYLGMTQQETKDNFSQIQLKVNFLQNTISHEHGTQGHNENYVFSDYKIKDYFPSLFLNSFLTSCQKNK